MSKEKVTLSHETRERVKKKGGLREVVVLDKGPFVEPVVIHKRALKRSKTKSCFGIPIAGFGDPSKVGH